MKHHSCSSLLAGYKEGNRLLASTNKHSSLYPVASVTAVRFYDSSTWFSWVGAERRESQLKSEGWWANFDPYTYFIISTRLKIFREVCIISPPRLSLSSLSLSLSYFFWFSCCLSPSPSLSLDITYLFPSFCLFLFSIFPFLLYFISFAPSLRPSSLFSLICPPWSLSSPA